MHALIRILDRVASGLALLGALGIAAILVQVTADVVLRYLFNTPVPATLELVSRYYMIAIAFFPLAWVERRGEMVTVDVFSGVYGELGIRILDTAMSVLGALIYAALAWTTLSKAVTEYNIGSVVMSLTVSVPVWPTYWVLPFAFAVAAIVSLARAALLATGGGFPPAEGRDAFAADEVRP
jgi:TRAP-type C4-dicarboxylate transport system permease small subunit